MPDSSGYSFYFTSNWNKHVLYCGVTNDLWQRVTEHYITRGENKTFAGRYFCYWLVYYEDFQYVEDAIAREKEVKKWNREKKNKLITAFNPDWKFLNYELFDRWPPEDLYHRRDQ